MIFNNTEYHRHPKIKTFTSLKVGQILNIKKQTTMLGDKFKDGCWNIKNMRSCGFIYECWNGLISKNKTVTNINITKIDNRLKILKLV